MSFYPKLALTNIKKNRQIYIPYLFTSIFTIAMYYIVHSLTNNQALENHETMTGFMELGVYVIIIFAFIFLFYANSFVLKRRKKEISLYSILGMEKRHIMVMMFCEMIVISIFSLIVGIIIGILFSQCMYMVSLNILHVNSEFVFSIPIDSLLSTIVIFMIIFLLSLLFNIGSVSLNNPIELLRGSNSGEREPKTKIIMTIVGLLTLGAGYTIAIIIDDPMTAIALFFVAVILVIIGTYCLFTAGSIALLKLLKKNKVYYYQTRHFTSVSGMIYRMKQNAVGLANICILCTCVLVTLSSTICLYKGIESTVDLQCPVDQVVQTSDQDGERLQTIVKQQIVKNHINISDYYEIELYELDGNVKDDTHIILGPSNTTTNHKYFTAINLITLDEFNSTFKENKTLDDGEVICYSNYFDKEKLFIGETQLTIKERFDSRLMIGNSYASNQIALVLKDEQAIKELIEKSELENLSDYYYYALGFNCKDEKLVKVIDDACAIYSTEDGKSGASHSGANKEHLLDISYEIYGSLMFLGLFLSVMFLVAAMIIIYNKQITEGYEDQKRFEILQNVGMSQKEVKQTINSQILIFFFLPLIVAVIHLSVAYKLIYNVLSGFLIAYNYTFIISCIFVVIGLIIVYSIVYLLTAKVYYRIVRK